MTTRRRSTRRRCQMKTKTHKSKAFQQAYERYMEEEAKREQESRSTGSEEECCRTCNCSVGGPDAMEGHGNYVLCSHWNETRTLDSVCMEWVSRE